MQLNEFNFLSLIYQIRKTAFFAFLPRLKQFFEKLKNSLKNLYYESIRKNLGQNLFYSIREPKEPI